MIDPDGYRPNVGIILMHSDGRVFWARRDDTRIDADLRAQWRQADAPRPILDGRFLSRPGVFAWNRVDAGSALLAEHLPGDLRGSAADLGAGWGFLADALLSPIVAWLNGEAACSAADLAIALQATAAAMLRALSVGGRVD